MRDLKSGNEFCPSGGHASHACRDLKSSTNIV